MSEEDDTRREWMWERYGHPETVDRETALALLGITDVGPDDVAAFRYRDQEAADAYAAANMEHWGHPTLGSCAAETGVIGVLDLREAVADMKRRLADEVARTGRVTTT